MAQPEALAAWWQHWRTRPEMRSALRPLSRFIATPRVSKHRIFVWCRSPTLPDNAVVVIARDDDITFGILQSKFHTIWSLRKGTALQNRPRYTPTTTFATFPFPVGLAPNVPVSSYVNDERAKEIAEASRSLDRLRSGWLNPVDLVQVTEDSAGLPPKVIPKDKNAAAELKKRTLVNLYNQQPAWLKTAHRDLDVAVAKAYGWPLDEDDDAILQRLLRENLSRAPVSNAAASDVELEFEEEDSE